MKSEAGILTPEAPALLPEQTRQAIYDVIALRRDVRHFDPTRAVDEATLERILAAAHLAPSVGFSQPWHFIVVRDRGSRSRVRDSFLTCRAAEAARFSPERRADYLAHKLEGILEAPINLCVAVDLRDQGEAILGTTVQPEAVRASACCAVQNLWLAARAEGIGVGWVSIVEPAVLRQELGLPAGVEPLAYLCMGHPIAFRRRPMLAETGWATRRPLADAIHRDRFQDPYRAPDGPPTTNTAANQRATDELPTFDGAASAASTAYQRRLVKPEGSLGQLEALAALYAGAHGQHPPPHPAQGALAVFAADHGVVVEGVSAYGSEVTAAMVATTMAGGSAIATLARELDLALHLVDVGVAGDLSTVPRVPVVPLTKAKVRAGSRNLRREAALSVAEVSAALAVGRETALRLVADGATILGVGEIGIGNTTTAAALVAWFCERPAADVVGRGTGLDDAGVATKARVVDDALTRVRVSNGPKGPLDILAELGGLEIAAMVGFILAGAAARRPVVLDGFVTNAAALVAVALAPNAHAYLVASHRSAEKGATAALAALQLTPVLDLGLRLGEGTGAALVIDLVRTAVALERSMATFATAGIVGRTPG